MDHCTIESSATEKFTSLYRTHKRKVFDYAMLLTQSQFQSEEIVQEVFLKIWINRHQLDLIDNFNGWLYTITRNKTLDCLRRISREQTVLKELKLQTNYYRCSALESIEQKESRQLLRLAVDNLSPQRKLIYQLIRVSGWKREEVARVLGISPNTVKCQMTIAIKLIKEFVQAELSMTV